MTTPEAAKYLGISYYYLRNMRHLLYTWDGPNCTQIKHPRGMAWDYTKEDLDSWKNNHKEKMKEARLSNLATKKSGKLVLEG
jgi:hypothetical protein